LRGAWTLLPTGSVVAKSNDLGASWGTIRRFTGNSKGAADTSAYLNVWRRDGPRWELVLSVVNPTR
jgi:hypothetical protein